MSPNTTVSMYATSGISVNCAHAPMNMSHGRLKRIRKSSVDNVSPIVSIITPRMMLDTSPLTQLNASGMTKANKAAAMTYADECEDNHTLTSLTVRFIAFRYVVFNMSLTDNAKLMIFLQKKVKN